MSQVKLRPGDLVEIRPISDIAKTLNAEGAMDSLPFMAEMLDFCGKRFRVSRRALIACLAEGGRRGFDSDNVVTLDDVRCSGAAHDGCQKACVIFWREEWLRKVEDEPIASVDLSEIDQFRRQLTINPIDKTYRCQATEILRTTHAISRSERVTRYLSGLRYGNFGLFHMVRSVATSVYWGIRTKLFGIYARGSKTKATTPTETLNLQPGEWVEVKSMRDILETLDEGGMNRGLYFGPDMHLLCGRKVRVRNRLDKMIVDETGQMRRLRNTVCLEGSTCGCAHGGIGMADCSRCEFTYWREIWLQRV